MKTKLLLRIASVLMLLHTIGHTLGALNWQNNTNTAIGQVIKGMQITHFNFMGRSTTLASFYSGYGYTMILVLLMITIILWFLSDEMTVYIANRIAQVLVVFLLGMGIIEYLYFFPFAAAFTLLAGLCTLMAVFYQNKRRIPRNAL